MPGVEMQQMNIQSNHVHLLMVIPPRFAVASVIGAMKQESSSIFRKRYRLFKNVYKDEPVMWSPGYFVSTIGIDEQIISRYIKYRVFSFSSG